MITIYEQGKGQGIGHSLDTFYERFIDICEDAKKHNSQKVFAFLLYDFNDKNIKKLLKDKGAFVSLDRLTGKELDVFYLHHKDEYAFKSFNKIFIHSFDFDKKLKFPIIIFFDVWGEEIEDVSYVEFDQSNFSLVFNNIYKTLEDRIKNNTNIQKKKPLLTDGLKVLSKVGKELFVNLIIDQIKERLH